MPDPFPTPVPSPVPDNRPEMLKGLTTYNFSINDDNYYCLDELVRPGVEMHVLVPGKCWAFLRERVGVIREFVIAEEASEYEGKFYVDVFWSGEGTGGSLRELRHSWFGEDGYIFYLNLDHLIAAAQFLKQHFDVH